MKSTPLNIIRLDDAVIVRITPDHVAPDAPHLLERLRPFLPKPDAGLHFFSDEGAPPWNNNKLAELVENRACRQFIILADDTSSYIVSLAIMAIEAGYNVFVVCGGGEDDAFSISRLENAGATFLLFDRFLEECGYRAQADNE